MAINPTKINISAVKNYSPPSTAKREISTFNKISSVPIDSKGVSFEKLLTAYTAYTMPIKTCGYKEIETFEVPDVGKGKVYELNNGHKVVILLCNVNHLRTYFDDVQRSVSVGSNKPVSECSTWTVAWQSD